MPPRSSPSPSLQPQEAADVAGLHYVSIASPGIARRRSGRGFRYIAPDGTTLRDSRTRERIRSLAIPPAWREVWICADPDGHIQAVGLDERGRKQYRYHPRWREVRSGTKFARMIAFASALPRIRQRTAADIAQVGLPREKVLAAIVQLLDRTALRVGNEEYARTNGSFGLTTLRNRHVTVEGAHIHLHFRGKSRVMHAVDLHDKRLARIIRTLQDLPGQELFQYVDEAGLAHSIGSTDVNAYLKEATASEFTAKDFRTWHGTVAALAALQRLAPAESEAAVKHNIVAAVKEVAAHLGNTPAVCRSSYIHPGVLECYAAGTLAAQLKSAPRSSIADELMPEEEDVLRIIQ